MGENDTILARLKRIRPYEVLILFVLLVLLALTLVVSTVVIRDVEETTGEDPLEFMAGPP
jgi:hypothetical protein